MWLVEDLIIKQTHWVQSLHPVVLFLSLVDRFQLEICKTCKIFLITSLTSFRGCPSFQWNVQQIQNFFDFASEVREKYIGFAWTCSFCIYKKICIFFKVLYMSMRVSFFILQGITIFIKFKLIWFRGKQHSVCPGWAIYSVHLNVFDLQMRAVSIP